MKAFFKQVVASFFGSCFSVLALGIFVVIGFFGAVGAMVMSFQATIDGEKPADFPREGSVLVIDLSRGFSDAPTFSPANNFGIFSNEKGAYGLLDTLRALEAARFDESVSGILLLGGNVSGAHGFASVMELRDALMHFRSESQKPVFAYLPTPGYKDYLLATAADEIWIHPLAELPLTGLSSTGLYFKNALENLGVGVQITRVGTHKSAVEPLISDKMSPEDREQRSRITGDLWKLTLLNIFSARSEKAESDEAKNLLAQHLSVAVETEGYVPAQAALEKKFVDAVYYEDEMLERLKTLTGANEQTHSFHQIALDDYLRASGLSVEPPLMTAAFPPATADAAAEFPPSLAVVYAEGEIVDGYGAANEVGGAWFSRALRELRNDDSVKAVVLRINSPGGSVFASEQIRREAELLAKKKTLVVSMGDVAASGGYWISTPAKRVFADPATITGSIGVFGVLFNFENLGKKIGVTSEAVLTAPFAELNSARRPKTPTEMTVFQKSTDKIYADFLNLVAKARGISVQEADALGQGQVWSGISATETKLVDELGGLAAAIAFAKKDAELGDDIEIISVPGEVHRFQELFDRFSDAPVPVATAGTQHALAGKHPALRSVLKNLERVAQRLRAFNDPNGLYARMPFDVEAK